MSVSALVCLAPGNEGTETITIIDLLVRGSIKVTTASAASDDNLAITYSRGTKLLTDASLVEVAGGEHDVIVLPGGIKGTKCSHDNTLLVETAKQPHRSGHVVVAICIALVTVLIPRDIFSIGNTTGLPTLKGKIPAEQRQDKRVIWDARVKSLASQGPDTAIDSGLKIIDLLARREKVHEMASQLVMAAGIYNYYEQCRM